MTFVDRPLPETLELPRLCEPRPRYNGKANLRNGPGIGRRKGSQDKITRDLKEGLIEGAVQAGFDGEGSGGLIGYCKWMAMFHPKAYALLLTKLLPYNIAANVNSAMINEVRIISVPAGQYVNKENMISTYEPQTIEQTPTLEAPASIETVAEIVPEPAPEPAPKPSVLEQAMAMGYVPLPPRLHRSD